jgi:acyl-CoA dehydrogenase
MTELHNLLAETAAKVFRGLREAGDTALPGWDRIADSGLCAVMVPETAGGFGGGWEDALIVFRQIGADVVTLPVAETIIANRLLAAANIALGDAPASFTANARGSLAGNSEALQFSGMMSGVPWGNAAARIVTRLEHEGVARLVAFEQATASTHAEYVNLAGEPRADLSFEGARVNVMPWPPRERHDFVEMGALARTCQIAGALDAVLTMTIEHAKTRQQFGRAIGNFQAIQQQLAVFASETAAVGAGAAAACRAADRGNAGFEIGCAKLRANRAVDVATSAAHQIHGAIGITREHRLHRYTQRLWSWKSEFGNDRHWAARLGGRVAARGADALWSDLVARSGA